MFIKNKILDQTSPLQPCISSRYKRWSQFSIETKELENYRQQYWQVQWCEAMRGGQCKTIYSANILGTTVDCLTLLLYLSLSLSLPRSGLCSVLRSEVKQFVRNVSLTRSDLLRKQGGNQMRNIGGELGAGCTLPGLPGPRVGLVAGSLLHLSCPLLMVVQSSYANLIP